MGRFPVSPSRKLCSPMSVHLGGPISIQSREYKWLRRQRDHCCVESTVNSSAGGITGTLSADSFVSPSGNYTHWTTFFFLWCTYTDTIANTSGCDSVITVNLTVNTTTDNTISLQVCHSPSFTQRPVYMDISTGTYNDTIANVNGCDSVITVQLIIDTTVYVPLLSTSFL